MRKAVGWGCLVFVILLVIGGLLVHQEVLARLAPMPAGDPELVTVVPGASAADIALLLEEAGLVRDALVFRLWLRYHGYGDSLQAGDYLFTPGDSFQTMVEAMQEGRVAGTVLTVPEGLTVRQIAQLVAEKGLAAEDEFLAAARRGELVEEFLPEGLDTDECLEGYLFPDTYFFRPQTTVDDVVEAMTSRFSQVFTASRRQRAQDIGFTAHEIATLASIIEREAVLDEERPVIAGVFHNRLQANWRLDADPTVLYAVGRPGGPVMRGDLDVESPYNTYRQTGLPPGPIANFGEKSLEAALYPEEVEYFFFVSRNDGTHAFSITYAEHSRKVDKYQR